jgi:predicted TIM-barrel fold metal-dependent hydrolase
VNADDLILISIDDHICEPADMFDGHVPEKYRQYTPVVRDEPNGSQQWYYGDLKGRNLGLNAVAGKPAEMYNIDAARYDQMRPGCFDVHERVRDMSAGGQLAGLNFPNWTGFSGQVLNQGPDRDVNLVMIKAYNDWHIDTWCAAYPDRFIPCGIVPLFDVDEAAKEVQRLAEKGCHAIAFSENPVGLNMPSIHSGQWDTLFAACVDTETVLCCHLGSSSRSTLTAVDAPPGVQMTLSSATCAFTLVDLLWAEFWHRFPTLKFSITEGDIGWMPYFLQRAEHIVDRHHGWIDHKMPQGRRPTQIFLDNIYCCSISDAVGVELRNHFNWDNVFWESDFPHSDSTWPNAPERLMEIFGGVEEEYIAKVTHENAMRAYQFDPFRHRNREQATVKALRAEAADVDTVTRVGRLAGDQDRATWREIVSAAGKR